MSVLSLSHSLLYASMAVHSLLEMLKLVCWKATKSMPSTLVDVQTVETWSLCIMLSPAVR